MGKEKKRIRGLLLVFTIISALIMSSCSQGTQTNSNPSNFKNISIVSLNESKVMDTINELTSSRYAGRLVGTEGNKLTQDYIADYFKQIGLECPDNLTNYMQFYKQNVLITNTASSLEIVDGQGKVVKKFVYPQNFISYQMEGGCIKGQITVHPVTVTTVDEINVNNTKLKGKVVLVPDIVKRYSGGIMKVYEVLFQIGVKGILAEVDPDNPKDIYKHLTISPYADDKSKVDNENGPMYLSIEKKTFNEIREATSQGRLIRITLDNYVEKVTSANVIGLLPGRDQKLKNEYIIISAHMDHVGDNKNGTYNPGALDNASGTAVLMDVARILKQNKIKPKKSILFIAFNGEEEGLLGSTFYANYPVYPLDKSVVINLDMVGAKVKIPLTIENSKEDESGIKGELYKYSKEFGIDSEMEVGSNSDHAPFDRIGIDSVTLIHKDLDNPGYHTNLDTADATISEKRILNIQRLILYYIEKEAY